MSDGRAVITAAKEGKWANPRQRGEVRASILAAAQALCDREGPEAVTLSALAKETGVARASIYSHFSGRQDLLSQLSVPHNGQETAVVDATSTMEVENEHVPEKEPADSDASSDTTSQTQDAESYDALMKAQAVALSELTKQVIVAKPRQRDAVDATLTRLEARMALAEQSVAALEQRVSEQLKTVQAETAQLPGALEDIRSRLEKFEERQQTALAELRLDVHNLHHRAEAVTEPVPNSATSLVETTAAPTSDVVEPDIIAEKSSSPPLLSLDIGDAPMRGASYLHSARQAAIHAGLDQARVVRNRSKLRRVLFRRRWLLIAIAAVLVAWFDFYVFANYPARGAVSPAAAAPVVRKPLPTPRAQLERGLRYLNGTGVATNVEKAARLIERAAVRGEPVAQNLAGVFYQTGTGVTADMATAQRWYETAAGQGNIKAMTNLGKLYAGGWKDGTDFVKAAEWFSRAAMLGDVDAQFDLAVLYELGQGVPRNVVNAYKWYAIAGKSGDRKAAQRASLLIAQLSPDEAAAANAAVQAFKAAPVDRAANEVPGAKA